MLRILFIYCIDIVSLENPELKEKVYFGISETPIKLKYANHFIYFNTVRNKNDTERKFGSSKKKPLHL